MIANSGSVADILDGIISKVEVELEQNSASLYVSQSRFQDVRILNKRSKLLPRNSVEDINCRICYDLNQELPVIYPCKCKVWES